MKIKFNLLYPIIFIGIAVFCGVSFIYFQQRGIPVEKNMYVIVPMIIVLSLPMFFVNYIVISDQDIVVNNQFGMPSKRYPIKSWEDLEMIGNKLYINKEGEKEKVRYRSFMASSRGLAELNAKLNKDL